MCINFSKYSINYYISVILSRLMHEKYCLNEILLTIILKRTRQPPISKTVTDTYKKLVPTKKLKQPYLENNPHKIK